MRTKTLRSEQKDTCENEKGTHGSGKGASLMEKWSFWDKVGVGIKRTYGGRKGHM